MACAREGAMCQFRALLLCGLAALAAARHDDDFAFDTGEQFRAEISNNTVETNGLRRLWGIPDTTAYVGHLFRMEIPNEAFLGNVAAYKVRSADGRRAPAWLAVDSRHGLLSGVPLPHDVGSHALLVTAHQHDSAATDTFTIEVKKGRSGPVSRCGPREGRLLLQLMLAAPLSRLSAERRARALTNLASFMALPGEEFYMEPYKPSGQPSRTTLQSGPGSARREPAAPLTAVYLNVGCGNKMWPRHKILVAGVREQARDGTLSHLLEMPLVGWRLLAETPAPAPPRPRRQAGDYDDGSGYDYNYDDDEDRDPSGDYGYDDLPDETSIKPSLAPSPIDHVSRGSSNYPSIVLEYPKPVPTATEPPVYIVPVPPTTTSEKIPIIEASSDPPTSTTTTAATTKTSVPTTPGSTTPIATMPSSTTTTPATVSVTSPVLRPVSTTEEMLEVTTVEQNKQEFPTTTEKVSTIDGVTTVTVDLPTVPPASPAPPALAPPPALPPPAPPIPSNHPPRLVAHAKKIAVTAGRPFRIEIPKGLFVDDEDGMNLTYTVYESDNTPLKPNSWVQFKPDNIIYGLPVEEHISHWPLTLVATDSAGASARAPLDIIVQHHKQTRTFNHQFVITLKLVQKYRYAIDWQTRVLEGIANVFRMTDLNHTVVRNVSSDGDLVTMAWSDDTLARDVCPIDELKRIMWVLKSDNDDTPSANLTRAMQPELKVASVRWEGAGECADTPLPAPGAPPENFPPVPRNQVDLVRATAGHLLVYQVPHDTFYDPEDGSTRKLRLSVVRGDRSPLPSAHWMQFDQSNQEFYGLPTDRDVGRKEYQLIAEDREGKTANDVLIVEVVPAPPLQPSVEFVMTMNYGYAQLAGSARAKRGLLEDLARLMGDRDTAALRVRSLTDSPTTIVWYNTSLPTDRCPTEEIEALSRRLIKQDEARGLTEAVDTHMHQYAVMSVRVVPRGACAHTPLPRPPPSRSESDKAPPRSDSDAMAPPRSDSGVRLPPSRGASNGTERAAPPEQSSLREYLVTFVIPAVVVVCMILVAAVIACALYRRRRTTGKMSVGDEEERQAFRSKGIPVIFQDELDEKPDTGNKSPVIMKEEKPPLLPPPDYKPDADSPTPSHHTPYRPPPPFTASRATSRPKATPSYRKPPPYVPP